jgi:predicted membrane metal-binding protein
MMSIVLVAVMLDRPALTMRNVALAALLILIVSPVRSELRDVIRGRGGARRTL